jgi:alkanesulfonate monooxygenase SsuD/methylene tetrahydromethanopterin reductase-like flavin-dependent oxidoreductase (luciferase family)
VNDPLLLIPAMAQVTRHLGLAVTCSVIYEHPRKILENARAIMKPWRRK